MEMVVTNWAINRAKLQSNHHHQQTKIQFFYGPDALPVAQPSVSKHWRENITFHGLAYPKLTLGLPTLSLTTNSSFVGRLLCLSSALWCQYLSCSCVKRPNLRSLTTLFLDVPEITTKTRYQGRTLLAHGSNFSRMVFLPPPVTPMDTSGSWSKAARYRSATLTTGPRLLLEPRLLLQLFLCTVSKVLAVSSACLPLNSLTIPVFWCWECFGETPLWLPPPFRLAASVLWCWSWQKEGRAVEVVPGI